MKYTTEGDGANYVNMHHRPVSLTSISLYESGDKQGRSRMILADNSDLETIRKEDFDYIPGLEMIKKEDVFDNKNMDNNNGCVLNNHYSSMLGE